MKEYLVFVYKSDPFMGMITGALEDQLNQYARDGYKVIHVSYNERESGYLFILEKEVAP